jgi:hypothetical protein
MRKFSGWNTKQRTWAVECLNYGAASQTNFKYNTGDLANSLLTEDQKTYCLESIALEQKQVYDAKVKGANLSLESSLSLNVFFTRPANYTGMTAKASFTDNRGNEKEQTYTVADFDVSRAGMIGIPVNTIVAADGRCLVTVTLYNADGTVYSQAIDSVESYAARKTKGADLYEAVMRYCQASYNYFH